MVMGGPMMGMAIYSLEVPVIKGSNGLLAFCKDEGDVSNATKCIRCGKCVDACPVRLMPTYLYQASQKGTVADMEEFNALDCIECGSCSFVCPAKLPLVQGIRCAKQLVMEERKKKK
jgi:electron transport complex protein RnfC